MEKEWNSYGNLDLISKLRRLKAPICKWNKETFGNIEFQIQRLEKELVKVESKLDEGALDKVTIARYQALQCVVQKWYERKDNSWK